MQPIETLIRQQLNTNQTRNLLSGNVDAIMEIEPDFLAALEEWLDPGTRSSAEWVYPQLVTFTANEVIHRLHAINPYLQMDAEQIDALEAIYRRTWQRMIQTGNIQATLTQFHYPELSRWLGKLYPEKFREALREPSEIGRVIYGEYSAEFQLALFGIEPANLLQPVVDIGCGGKANLVKALRAAGIEAYGIDRFLEIDGPYFEQADWFDYPFEQGKWGTVLANMSFTNHLNYAYLHDVAQLERYLLKAKEIFESLAPGGCFYYAPGLPFVEEKLPIERYQVKRCQKAGSVPISIVRRIL